MSGGVPIKFEEDKEILKELNFFFFVEKTPIGDEEESAAKGQGLSHGLERIEIIGGLAEIDKDADGAIENGVFPDFTDEGLGIFWGISGVGEACKFVGVENTSAITAIRWVARGLR